MYIAYDDYEYNNIVNDILCNREFKKLEDYKHHGINRIEHSRRVSFISYKLCKSLGLDYVSAARGGLLHDFFLNKYIKKKRTDLLLNHPAIALYNSKKHFKLNDMEKDIIKSHMFPVNMKYIPKYRESYIVSFADKLSCVYERVIGYKAKMRFCISKILVYIFIVFNL